jgi:hypothetical protein
MLGKLNRGGKRQFAAFIIDRRERAFR